MAESDTIDSFLKTFFGTGNDISWEDVCSNESYGDALGPWIERLRQRQPSLLPRLNGDELFWYGLAFSAREKRALCDDLVAAVGPGLSDFNGAAYCLSTGDPVDEAILTTFGDGVCRLRVDQRDVAGVRDRLDRMRMLWDLRPSLQRQVAVPIGRLLRDFSVSVRARNEGHSLALIHAIRKTGHLSAENLLYLEIERLAGLDEWEAITTHVSFSDLLGTPVPSAIADSILKAVYLVRYAHHEGQEDGLDSAIAELEQDATVYVQAARRLGTRFSPEVAKLVLLISACGYEVSDIDRERALDQVADQSDSAFACDLCKRVSSIPPEMPSDTAEVAYRAYDFASCFNLLIESDLDVVGARMLIHSAVELGEEEAAEKAQRALETIPSPVLDGVLSPPFIHEKWVALRALMDKSGGLVFPHDWMQWVQMLRDDPQFRSRAAETAREGLSLWTCDVMAKSPQEVAAFVRHLEETASIPEALEVLKLSFPSLLTAFLPDSFCPDPGFKEVYSQLLTILALDNQIGVSDLEVVHELVRALLDLGQTIAVFDALEVLFLEHASVRRLDWMLDSLDILLVYGKGDAAVNTGLLSSVLQLLSAHPQRITPMLWHFAELLATELGQSKSLPSRPDAGVPIEAELSLRGNFVGIYSLTERAARRAKQLVERLFNPARVETNADKVGTSSLRSLAKEADILVVVTRSAKHAATEVIQQVRSSDLPTLYPNGKGSSSILRALLEYQS